MTASMEKNLREYMNRYYTPDQLKEYSAQMLAFSYLLGMPAEECRDMYPESDWSNEQLEEYDDIEGMLHRIKSELD